MGSALFDALSLVGPGGLLIIGATVLAFMLGVGANLYLRARYAGLERDLTRNSKGDRLFSNSVLNRIVDEARRARDRSREVNTQAIIEDSFQAELGSLLLGERFVKSATGLVIILGLLGTFYGLTLSIGKLVGLVTGEATLAADVTQAVTKGLTQSLSGMSVAFSNSLFGIAAAVLLTVLGIVSNVTDSRTALMVRIETYLDRMLSDGNPAVFPIGGVTDGTSATVHADKLERVVGDFGQSVARLEGAVARFDSALGAFATSTRDFKEFNLHLKDNVQRMSLSFGDFSETLKSQIVAMKSTQRD